MERWFSSGSLKPRRVELVLERHWRVAGVTLEGVQTMGTSSMLVGGGKRAEETVVKEVMQVSVTESWMICILGERKWSDWVKENLSKNKC